MSAQPKGWDEQFGRGYAVAFFAFFVVAMVSGVAAAFGHSVRWVAVFIAAFGGGWSFALLYHAVRGIGFPSGNLRNPRVLLKRRNPIAYWLVVAVGLAVSFAAVGFAVWLWVNADAATAFMARHQATHAGE